ncbi:MAG: hypothetical protein HXS46_01580 [Theionarchaea archaeon]|nr:hypothetical protein [Theionarchaea archaeon]
MALVLLKLDKYSAIYGQIWDNLFISISKLAQKTNMAKSAVSRYLAEMNRKLMTGLNPSMVEWNEC